MKACPLLLLGALGACVHQVPDPGQIQPVADAPPAEAALTVCWVEYATGKLPHGQVVAHHALDHDVVSTQSGLLLIHPKGTWLVDGGMEEAMQADLKEVHGLTGFAFKQAAKGWTRVATPADALRAAGADPGAITGLIATHAHFDHLGGLLDLPNVPIYLPQAEIDSATWGFGVMPADAVALPARAKPIAFSDTPLLMWNQSWDVFGDHSAVVVPMPGHTPGSVGVRVWLPDGRAVLLVGDTVWVREGYEQRQPKGFIAAPFDYDHKAIDAQIGRLWALHRADPSLAILPSHDRRVWEQVFGHPGCVRAGAAP